MRATLTLKTIQQLTLPYVAYYIEYESYESMFPSLQSQIMFIRKEFHIENSPCPTTKG